MPTLPPSLLAAGSVAASNATRLHTLEDVHRRTVELADRAGRCGTGAELSPVVRDLARELARLARTEATHGHLVHAVAPLRRGLLERLASAWRAFWR